MDQYEALKFSQLSVANKSSVLLFTKDKFSQLGKKLRPEFEKFYVSSELKDCLKLLGTSNEISAGAEPTNAVDMVSKWFCIECLTNKIDVSHVHSGVGRL